MVRPVVLAVDDDPLILDALRFTLGREFEVHAFGSPRDAETFLNGKVPDAAIVDLNFPAEDGAQLIQRWGKKYPRLQIITCSGEVKMERAMECLRLGAADYLAKPFHRDDLLRVIHRTLEKHNLRKRTESERAKRGTKTRVIGDSVAIREVLDKIELLKGQTHLNVLILGESGTGKELIARLLHEQEEPRSRPFVVANMAAIPATLLESEFFGVEKGAYTDARATRAGKFELADGGDIFLDEIGDLPSDTQAKILRVLQEKQIERLGGHRTREVRFRVIAATNRPLADLIADGSFREDLMYRLSDMVIWLPSLRERPEDIPALVNHFATKYGDGGAAVEIAESALQSLMTYAWPGNVRQLESTIKRALIFNRGKRLEHVEIFDPATLNPVRPPATEIDTSYEARLQGFERDLIAQSLRRNEGDRGAVLRELKLSKATFYRKVQQLGISLD